jgi:transcriptional regulator with XRE-family HTH domain
MDDGFAERLTALMTARGLGVLAVARRIPCDKAMISRLANGKQQPSDRLARRLDDVLGAGGRLYACRGEDPGRRRGGGPEPRDGADDLNRRELLRIFTMAGGLLAAGLAADWDRLGSPGAASRRVAPADVAELAALNAHLWRVFTLSRSKRLVFPLVRDQLEVVTGCLQRPHGPAVFGQLCAVASDLFQLAGEILFDQSRYADAAHCYTLAASAGDEAGSPDLQACALTRHAFIGVYEGRPGPSVAMLELAAVLAGRGDRGLSTWHWVAAVQAEALAGLGDLRGCQRSLSAAEPVTGLGGQIHNGGWLRFDGSRLAEERGTCYVALGQPQLAETALLSALAGNLSARRRGVVLADLALAGVQRRDLDQTVAYAEGALAIASDTGSGVVARKLTSLQGALGSLASDARTRQLSRRIGAVAAGPDRKEAG